MKIGILALQGAFIEHIRILAKLGVETHEVRKKEGLNGLDGLIIPGGESTTMGKLSIKYGLVDPIRRFAAAKAVWGTCAGMILMAKNIGNCPALLQLMDITVKRNGFGRQAQSFQSPVTASVFPDGQSQSYPAVFIRAPKLVNTFGSAEIIARLPDGTPVGVRQGKRLSTAFHPELSTDDRFHRYFLALARK